MIDPATLKRAITPGVTERPPSPGWAYVAFVVHPRCPGPVVLAIAHREGEKAVVDLIRESITIDDAAPLLKRYGISEITGAPDEDEGDSLAHAVCGAIVLAMEKAT